MTRGNVEGRFVGQIRSLFEAGFLGDLPDGQLIDRFRSGAEGAAEPAFAALIERHGPMVMGVCRRLLADSHLAEDAFQATFLVLARRAGSVREREAVGAWLHRVARRVATRAKIRADRRKAREHPGAAEAGVAFPDRVELDEIRAAIDEEVGRLGHAQRLPFVLCCLEGLSHEEASRRLRWPIGTVKSRLARGRRRLQDRLTRRGLAPAAAAAGAGLVGVEATAAVSPVLVEATSAAVAGSLVRGGLSSGAVPAAVAALAREELGSLIAGKLKLAALAAAGSAAALGLALAAPFVPKPAAVARLLAQAGLAAPAARLSVAGKVVDADGRAIPGARVILREWALYRLNELPTKEREEALRTGEIPDTLAEVRSDAAGEFRFREVPAPAFAKTPGVGKTVFPWDVVALADGRGLAWDPITAVNQRDPITLTLGAEGTLRGRVVEPGGRPVAGASVKVVGIDPLGHPDVNGVATRNRLNLSWSALPLGARTDAAGRFAIGGLPRDRAISLGVTEAGHEYVFAYAATTDEPQAEAVGRIFHSGKTVEVRRPVLTGDFTLTAKTNDHALAGRVVFEADGKPAANARVIAGPANVTADADGRFRIDRLAAGKLELHAMAFGSDAAPFDGEVAVPEAPGDFEREIRLPRGMVLTGRVLDGADGVAKVLVDYVPKYETDQTPTLFGLSRETDADGRFRLVVPAGRGTLDLRTIPPEFPQPPRTMIGEPRDARFTREVEGAGGQAVEVAAFRLRKAEAVTLRLLDPEGRPVPGARVEVRDFNRLSDKPGRSDAAGRFAVIGLEEGKEMVVDIADEGASWARRSRPRRPMVRSRSGSGRSSGSKAGCSTRTAGPWPARGCISTGT